MDNINHNISSEEELQNLQERIKILRQRIDSLPAENDRLENEFENHTKLTTKDDKFLVFASSLQVARQLLTSHLKQRKSDKEAANSVKGNSKEHSNRTEEKYYASIDEIRSNPVPFDCIIKEPDLKRSPNSPKLSGFNHRYKTLGHDPLLGLLFGTVNIMTKTITITEGVGNIKTYHVHTGIGTRISTDADGNIKTTPYNIDKINDIASTSVAFEKVGERLLNEGKEGWKALGFALGKELAHLLSDVNTKKSLPLPFTSVISPNLPRLLNYAGIDMFSASMFTVDMVIANIINFIIIKLHELCYDSNIDGDQELYDVRTKKILLYSSEIALASTTLQTAVRLYLGDKSSFGKFDYGGSFVALSNIWNSPLDIARIKHEYKLSRLEKHLTI